MNPSGDFRDVPTPHLYAKRPWECSHLPPGNIDDHNKGMSRVQVSDIDRGAEPSAERSEQMTAREARNTSRHYAHCRAYRLKVEKGGCQGVQLDSCIRDDIILLSEGPRRDADGDQEDVLRHLPDGACT